MKILNEANLREFDKLKDNIFTQKKHQYEQSKVQNNKIEKSHRIRPIIKKFIFFGCSATLIHYFWGNISEELMTRQIINRQSWMAIQSIYLDLQGKVEAKWINRKRAINGKLTNNLYAMKMESDLNYLMLKTNQKKLCSEINSKFSIWIFHSRNQEISKLINETGDLIERTQNSKFKIGDSIRIWSQKKDRLLLREKIFSFYEAQIHNSTNQDQKTKDLQYSIANLLANESITNSFVKQCSTVNWFNRIFSDEKQTEQQIKQCENRAKQIGNKISSIIKGRLAKEFLAKQRQNVL